MVKWRAELKNGNEWIVTSNMKCIKTGNYNFYATDEVKEIDDDIYSLIKRNHGIAVCRTKEYIEIINDPFCTIPIYIYCKSGKVVVDSVFENFKGMPLATDVVGCYETLIYGSGLYDRTPFREIKQMPAASKACYSFATNSLKFETYWDYGIKCNEKINENEAVDIVWNILAEIYKKYNSMNIVMGISGGLDSRLSLCLLKKAALPHSIKTFTFGHYKGIKDYQYAIKICRILGITVPEFFRLTGDDYIHSEEIPCKTGGGVGINHCHSYCCLKKMDLQGKILISNYYSDGVLGYDCRPEDAKQQEASDYFKLLNANEWNVPKDIHDAIWEDLCKITARRSKDDNYSGYNEYIYLTERNPKFHMKLSYLYSELLEVESPFAEYDLLNAVISLPQKLRYYKKIEHLILQEKLGDYADISSTRYAGWDKEENSIKNKIWYNTNFIYMLFLNRINSALKLATNGMIQMPNPYITENHLAIFDRYFADRKKNANEILTEELALNIHKNPLCRQNIRTSEAARGFNMISLAETLKTFIR